MEITRQEMNEFWAQEQASAREVQGHLLASQRTVVGTIAECALGCNARTYNPICNAHAPKPPSPIPEPTPELCAFPGCPNGVAAKHCTGTTCDKRSHSCHDFVAPQAKPVSAGTLQNIGSIGAAGELIPAKPVLREPKPRAEAAVTKLIRCKRPGCTHQALKELNFCGPTCAYWPVVQPAESGPSAVAAAPGIEPWRPSVDDWDLLPNAVEGWRP